MDLEGISNMLIVIKSSEYYREEDRGIFRGVRNSIDFTKSKLDNLMNLEK